MSGNFSRYSHQPDRRYTSVSPYQAAMVTDADQLEAAQLSQRGDETLGDLSIGSGVPLASGVLEYATVSGPPDVLSVSRVVPGRVVADGRWGELRLRSGTALGTAALDILAKQADFELSPAAPTTGDYLVCADLFDLHIGPAADKRLTDPAFLGAETSGRYERLAQIKLVPMTAVPTEGFAAAVERGLPRFGDLRLTSVRLAATTVAKDDCDPCAVLVPQTDGQASNTLFRLEVHASPYDRAGIAAAGVTCASPETGAGANGRIVLKFSKDNGSVEVAGEARALIVGDTAYATAVFELTDAASEQQLGLAAHAPVARSSTLLTPAGLAALTDAQAAGKIIRVWDGACSIDLLQGTLAPAPVGTFGITGTIARAAGWTLILRVLDLELSFAATPGAGAVPFILPGDAYVVDLREYAANAADQIAFRAEPVETPHAYAWLGRWTNGAFAAETALTDLRSRRFPATTGLDAQSVAWSKHHHPTVATNTVQGALDLLFARPQGGQCLCTFCLEPDSPFAEQMTKILLGLPAEGGRICLPPGTWLLNEELEFVNQETKIPREVIFVGSGAGLSRIEIGGQVGRLLIGAFARVTLQDLAIVSGTALNPFSPVPVDLADNITVMVRDCTFSGDESPNVSPASPLPLLGIHMGGTLETASATVTDCSFSVLQNRLGLRIEGGGRRVVTGCSFTGADPRRNGVTTFDIGQLTISSRMERRPADFVENDARGLFAMAGNPDFVLNLSSVPEPARPDVAEFLRRGPELLGLPEPKTIDDWRETEAALTRAAGMIDELQVGTMRRRINAPFVADLTDTVAPGGDAPADVPLGGFVTMTTSRRLSTTVAGLTQTTGVANRALAEEPGVTDRTSGATASPNAITFDFGGNFGTIDVDIDKVDVMIDRLIRLKAQAGGFIYRRNFGLWSIGTTASMVQIENNQFRNVHSAIIVQFAADDPYASFLLPASKSTIANNFVLRATITGDTEALVEQDGKPVTYHAGITIENGGYLTLAGNTVQQSPGTEATAASYIDYVTQDGSFDPLQEGFAAILLRGNFGPAIHVTANAALYFRACIAVMGDARWQLAPEDEMNRRQNLWTFRDNNVLPVKPGGGGWHEPVLLEPPVETLNKMGNIRVGLGYQDYNHPAQKG